MENLMRPFSGHENDSTKSYSHFSREQFPGSLMQTSKFYAIFSKADFDSRGCFIIRGYIYV